MWARLSRAIVQVELRALDEELRAELRRFASSHLGNATPSPASMERVAASMGSLVRDRFASTFRRLTARLRACTEDAPRAAIRSQEWERTLREQLETVSSFLQVWNNGAALQHTVRAQMGALSERSQGTPERVSDHLGFILKQADDTLSRWIREVTEQLDHQTIAEELESSLDPDPLESAKTERLDLREIARRAETLRQARASAPSELEMVAFSPEPASVPPSSERTVALSSANASLLPPAPPAEALLGSVIAERYRLLTVVARGGAGVVYKAEDLRVQQLVALKLMSCDPVRVDDVHTLRQRFRMEAARLAQLTSPFTVRVHDYGEWQGTPFLVMELVNGHSVAELLKRGPIPPGLALQIAQQICHSLGEAHACGLVHRDLTPSNVLVVPSLDGTEVFIKVVDFGLAKGLMDGPNMTKTGMLLGTPKFMSPEQAQGHWLDHRSDLYSLGVLLFVMLTAESPYEVKAPTMASLLLAHLHAPPRTLWQVAPHLQVPRGLQEAIDWCLVKDPARRCHSAQELLVQLRECKLELDTGTLYRPVSLTGSFPQRSASSERVARHLFVLAIVCSMGSALGIGVGVLSLAARMNGVPTLKQLVFWMSGGA
ncbi:MAG: protein kinase [Myxococcales bacterium]|nr:protein kinase [Myxococcales bacterium]